MGSINLDEDVLAVSPPGNPTSCPPLSGWKVKVPCEYLHRVIAIKDGINLQERNISCRNQEENFEPNYELETFCIDGTY